MFWIGPADVEHFDAIIAFMDDHPSLGELPLITGFNGCFVCLGFAPTVEIAEMLAINHNMKFDAVRRTTLEADPKHRDIYVLATTGDDDDRQ